MDPVALKKTRIGTVVVSFLFYAIFCGIQFQPEVHETMVKAFGEAPLGMPVTAVVIVVQSLLYIPMPFVFYHGALLAVQSQQEGGPIPRGPFTWLMVLTEAEKNPELRKSAFISLGGFFYFCALLFAWCWYADSLGI